MRTVITAADVEAAASAGVREISETDAIVTDAAREVAARLGVRFVSGPPREVPPARTGLTENRWDRRIEISEEVAAEWKKEFPILERYVHVANCSQSPQSRRVRTAIEKYLNSWANDGMDWDTWLAECNAAKTEFARLINADPDEIAISSSVSEATASLASTLPIDPRRPKVVLTEADFPTVGHVWLANQKYGWKVDFVPVREGEVSLGDYERYVDESTVITSVTHVYYQNGFRQDLAAIADIVHRKGSLIFVDAYQSLGTVDIDVKKMGVDFLTSGCLKYLLGVPGIAFLYVSKKALPRLKPAVTGWFGQENPFSFQVRILDYASDARRFDTGTPPLVNAYAARAGMSIIREVGVRRIQERIEMLSAYTIEEALRRGLDVASPRDPRKKGATTAIRVPDPHEVEVQLKKRGVIASARGDVIRIAPHFFTLIEDIDRVLEELQFVLKNG